MKNCTIHIFGNNNKISIGSNCLINEGTFWIEDNEGVISIDKNTTINGKTEFACIEGKEISIGSDCMFSSNIVIRTGDSHSIIDSERLRTNPSNDVKIGNHVWIGEGAVLLKGIQVLDNSIVGTRSVVTKPFYETNIIIAGTPAKIIRRDINWLRERIV